MRSRGALLNVVWPVVVVDHVALVIDWFDIACRGHVLVDRAGCLQYPVRNRVVVASVGVLETGCGSEKPDRSDGRRRYAYAHIIHLCSAARCSIGVCSGQ